MSEKGHPKKTAKAIKVKDLASKKGSEAKVAARAPSCRLAPA
jgi:hypothetical protein